MDIKYIYSVFQRFDYLDFEGTDRVDNVLKGTFSNLESARGLCIGKKHIFILKSELNKVFINEYNKENYEYPNIEKTLT